MSLLISIRDLMVKDSDGNIVPIPRVLDMPVPDSWRDQVRSDGLTRALCLSDGRCVNITIDGPAFSSVLGDDGVVETVWTLMEGPSNSSLTVTKGDKKLSTHGWYIRVQAGISG